MTKRSKYPGKHSNTRPIRQPNIGCFMLNEVRVYDKEGKLKKIVGVEDLEKRSDQIIKGTLKLVKKKVKPEKK